MRAHDGGIDHRLLVIGVVSQMLEKLLPNAALGPPGKPGMNLYGVAKSLRQIAPRNARTITIQHGLDK